MQITLIIFSIRKNIHIQQTPYQFSENRLATAEAQPFGMFCGMNGGR